VIFDGSVHEFFWRSSSENCSDFTSSNFLLKNSSIVKQFFANFSAEAVSSARRMYSSLKVNIADGSIPIKATS
jgi:hypothetical protein